MKSKYERNTKDTETMKYSFGDKGNLHLKLIQLSRFLFITLAAEEFVLKF